MLALLAAISLVVAAPPQRAPEPARLPGEEGQVDQPAAKVTPRGYLQMFVAAVMPTGDGHTVVLVNPAEELLIPVGVALPEAVTIFGRLEQRAAPRPLTHDLLDHVVTALGAEVVAVHIDDLHAGAARSTVFLRRRGAIDVVALDARPSDAMAVALSARAPIFVARPVVDAEALTHDDLAQGGAAPSSDERGARTYEL